MKRVIANKAGSSGSMRAWILLRPFDAAFGEPVVPLDLPETRARLRERSPTRRAPVPFDGGAMVRDSLAIVEDVAGIRPDPPVWPRDRQARALARSSGAVTHSDAGAVREPPVWREWVEGARAAPWKIPEYDAI